MGWWTKLWTEVDNVTPDWSKIQASFVSVLAMTTQIWDVVMNHTKFDMQAFGIGFGALFGGFAALLKFKKESNVPFNPPATPAVSADVAIVEKQ